MLSKTRLANVMDQLHSNGAEQMLVTDPVAIFYLTGKWIHPGERFLSLLLKQGQKPVLFLNELFRFEEEIGVDKVYITDTTDLVAVLKQYVNPDGVLGIDKQMAARFLLQMIDAKIAAGFINSSIAIDHVRSIKDETEIELMRHSSLINDQAMVQFKALIHEGVYEDEVAAQCMGIYKALGAEAYSFDPIVAFGANSADPHHMPDHTQLKEGDTVLFDVGCRYHDYCSDMTRTFFYKKAPAAEHRNVYELVKQANQSAEDMLKPGIELCKVDAMARDIITDGGYGKDFTHRLGHFIGIEDHDFGDVSAANHNLTAAGNIFSIEPGIYSTKQIGVRLEDLVLITADGHEVLNHYSKEIEVIE
ncbi:MAG: Xaa-Pro peptidase family protein [Solobacterium sp.]|jgi:Xaa-Pro dipeptidase|nr:Xaa-Pro peptidase family protein [Solobacterium sp.]MCH4222297.1 Xaa-Pro peptidase family protein [Solobacterium sp.]MCH4265662.1 Xaa-Pro peptidase family protein [Solobacterium sp.]